MNITFKHCVTDDDYAGISLFLLERKFDLHQSFTTLQMVTLLYSYITQGYLHQGALPDGRIIVGGGCYIGTPANDFADRNVALIDSVILDKAYRGTRYFFASLQYIIDWIRKTHPEVEEVRLAALSENAYLCRLYAKFASFAYKQEGSVGEETVFAENIDRMGDILSRFRRV